MITDVDTDKLREIAYNINSLAADFEIEYKKMFARFSDVPFVTREWVGRMAEYYFDVVSLDKKSFDDLCYSIRNFSDCLIKNAEKLETDIKVICDKESVKEIL